MAVAKQLKTNGQDMYPYTWASLVYMNNKSTMESAYNSILQSISGFSSSRGFIQFYDEDEIPSEEREPNTLYGRIISDYNV